MTNQPEPNTTSNQETFSGNGNTPATSTNSAPNQSIRLIIPPPDQKSQQRLSQREINASDPRLLLTAVAVMAIGLWFELPWVGFSGGLTALFLSLRVIFPAIKAWFAQYLTPQERKTLLAAVIFIIAIAGMAKYFRVYDIISFWLNNFKYDEFGSWAEWVGALGQIMIAVLAVYVAWQQYVISRDLTIQQNRITQQQTIDAYFQGVSDLVLDGQGMLEDWPQERALAEGRTAAILGSLNAEGKAKVLRFLSQSKLLTPLARDSHLGRPIFDGNGGYAEDRYYGVRVINLGVMLAGADLSYTDLRWTDLSEANMVRANLSGCDLVKANLSRTVLYEANLEKADFKGVRLFYGTIEQASPRSRNVPPDYQSGTHTGAVIENSNLTDVKNLSDEQRYYCCAWGGEQTRATIPGGCEGIPNQLGR